MKQNALCIFFVSLFFSAITGQQLLTIMIPAFNNKAYVTDTLDSIRIQTHQNYRIIYIDDGSTDGSFEVVQNYISKHNWHDKVTVIQNKQRHRKLRNIYYALHYLCDDDEIIVFVDCDDKLAHNKALERVAKIMSNEDVWFMYGNDKAFPEKEARKWGVSSQNLCAPTDADIIKKNAFRSGPWVYMHIRAFRAWLYKKIHLHDLLSHTVDGFKGKFYPACNDYANIYPMLEMAGSHIFFNKQLIYLYNAGSPLNGFKVDRGLQFRSAREIQLRPRYQPLKAPMYQDQSEPIVSVVIKDENNQAYLKNSLNLKDNVQIALSETILQQSPQPISDAFNSAQDDYIVIINTDEIKYITSEMLENALIDLKKTHAEWIHLCTQDQIAQSLITQYIKDDLYAYAGWINMPQTDAYAHICKRSCSNQLSHILNNTTVLNNEYVGLISIIDANS